jgi:putative phosphoesterase
MRIAVISDTHDRISHLPWELLRGAGEIWHLGDVCSPEVIATLQQLGPPVLVVRGNCDITPAWPPVLQVERAGLQIRLQHHPPVDPPPAVDLLLHGHTHQPCDWSAGGARILNPGPAGLANKGAPRSMGWLSFEGGRARFEIVALA